MYKNIVAIITFAVVLSSFAVLHKEAQAAVGVKIQPSLIEERVDAGETFSSVLRITNLGDEKETFYFETRTISGISEDGTPQFKGKEIKSELDLISWITISKTSVTLGAKGIEEVPFSIRIPKNAPPGGHFASILVGTRPPQLQGIGASIAYEAGMIVALRVSRGEVSGGGVSADGVRRGGVKEDVVEEAGIREFSTNKTIYSKPNVKFVAKVENLGNVLVRPRGPIEITDSFGKKAAAILVNEEGVSVFPGQTRKFETSWQGEGLAFGRYQVVMSLTYGEDEKKTISAFLSFWVLPTNIILPIIGGMSGLILAIFLFIKLSIKKRLRELSAATGAVERGSVRSQRGAPFPRLAFFAIAILVSTMVFLLALFFFFA